MTARAALISIRSFLKKHLLSIIITVVVCIALIAAYKYVAWYSYYKYNQYENLPFYGSTPCSHDLSYQEPVVPNGKYYLNGDESAPLYIEITEFKYWELKSSDGKTDTVKDYLSDVSYYKTYPYRISNPDGTIDYMGVGQKVEFKVITDHCVDYPYLYRNWSKATGEYADYPGTVYQGDTPLGFLYVTEEKPYIDYSDNENITICGPYIEGVSISKDISKDTWGHYTRIE